MKIKFALPAMLLFSSFSAFALSIPGQEPSGPSAEQPTQEQTDQAKGTGGQNVATEEKTTQMITDYRSGIQDSSTISKAPPSKMIKPIVAQ